MGKNLKRPTTDPMFQARREWFGKLLSIASGSDDEDPLYEAYFTFLESRGDRPSDVIIDLGEKHNLEYPAIAPPPL